MLLAFDLWENLVRNDLVEEHKKMCIGLQFQVF